MVSYSFKCKDCGHQFNCQHLITEEHPKNCVRCNSKNISQIYFSPLAIVYTGEGFTKKGKK